MKKVLFVSENYFPNVSGVPVVVQYLAEGLVDNGYEVSIVTTLHENLEAYEILNNVHIYRFNLFQNSLKKYCGDIDTYLQFIKNFTCDVLVVECAHCITTDLLLPCLKQITCKKYFTVMVLLVYLISLLRLSPILFILLEILIIG